MRLFPILLGLFAAAWFGAFCIYLIGLFELFGQEQDSLAAVFLIILGQPWVRAIDMASEAAWPWLVALAPGMNLSLAFLLYRVLLRGKHPGE